MKAKQKTLTAYVYTLHDTANKVLRLTYRNETLLETSMQTTSAERIDISYAYAKHHGFTRIKIVHIDAPTQHQMINLV